MFDFNTFSYKKLFCYKNKVKNLIIDLKKKKSHNVKV